MQPNVHSGWWSFEILIVRIAFTLKRLEGVCVGGGEHGTVLRLLSPPNKIFSSSSHTLILLTIYSYDYNDSNVIATILEAISQAEIEIYLYLQPTKLWWVLTKIRIRC